MSSSRKLIEQKYYKQIRDVNNNKAITNAVFIFDTIIDDPRELLSVSIEDNDVFFGSTEDIDYVRDMGYNIN